MRRGAGFDEHRWERILFNESGDTVCAGVDLRSNSTLKSLTRGLRASIVQFILLFLGKLMFVRRNRRGLKIDDWVVLSCNWFNDMISHLVILTESCLYRKRRFVSRNFACSGLILSSRIIPPVAVESSVTQHLKLKLPFFTISVSPIKGESIRHDEWVLYRRAAGK